MSFVVDVKSGRSRSNKPPDRQNLASANWALSFLLESEIEASLVEDMPVVAVETDDIVMLLKIGQTNDAGKDRFLIS